MVSGSTVHKKIKGKIAEVEQQHESLGGQLYSTERQIQEKSAQREGIYINLAQVYLPELTAKAVAETLPQLRTTVNEIFNNRQAARVSLEQRMAATQQQRKTLEVKLDDVTEKLEAELKAKQTLEQAVNAELGGNAAYTTLIQQAEKLQANAQTAESRKQDALREKKEKAPGYEGNKLFAYLARRNFGTDAYTGNFLTRPLDAWVARIIHYHDAKRSYDQLAGMPVEIQKLITAYKKDLDGVAAEIAAIEKEAADRHGLTTVLDHGNALLTQRKSFMDTIAKADADYNKLSQDRNGLDNTKGVHYEQALGQLKSYLKGETIADLRARAKSTTNTSVDDRLVENLEAAEGEINDAREKAKKFKAEQATIADRLEELRSVEREFRRKEYDASSSRFSDGLNIDTLLIAILLGRMSSSDASRQMGSSHHWEQTYSSPSYSSSSSSHSGGGFGGGGFSSGGGFGGGGFSSGGGFGR